MRGESQYWATTGADTPALLQPFAAIEGCCFELQFRLFQKEIQMLRRTLVALAATVALGCLPIATNAFAAGHSHGGGHAGGRVAGSGGGRMHYARGGGHRHFASYGGGGYGVGSYGYPGYGYGYPAYGYGYGYPGYDYGYGPAGVVGGVIGGLLGGF
jgi:hypothetical protein